MPVVERARTHNIICWKPVLIYQCVWVWNMPSPYVGVFRMLESYNLVIKYMTQDEFFPPVLSSLSAYHNMQSASAFG